MLRFLLLAVSLSPFLVNPAPAKSDHRTLDRWINFELLPFLENRLGKHPRLKGQAFEIISAKKNAVPERMDGLSAYIRQKVIDRLQAMPGANLVLRPPASPWRSANSLSDVVCKYREGVPIQVIIELDDRWFTGELRVSVQAFDLLDNQWVQGFKKVWVGMPNFRERKLLANQVNNLHQIGSRGLPFQSDQPDLLASYLAERLSCQLKTTGVTAMKLAVPKTSETLPNFFQTTFELLHHYLSKFQEIKITEQKFANIFLTSNAHVIEPKLYQVTARVHSVEESIQNFQVGTEAYVLFDKTPHIRQTPRKKAFIAKRPRKETLIEYFELIAPKQQSECSLKHAWRHGTRKLNQTSRLNHHGCFALRFKAAETVELYLLAQTDDTAIVRLFPNSCNGLGLQTILPKNKVRKGQTIHAPLSETGTRLYFRLDQRPGTERIYAIALVDKGFARDLRNRIESMDDLCVSKRNVKSKTLDVRPLLNKLARYSQGLLEWQVRSFVHVP